MKEMGAFKKPIGRNIVIYFFLAATCALLLASCGFSGSLGAASSLAPDPGRSMPQGPAAHAAQSATPQPSALSDAERPGGYLRLAADAPGIGGTGGKGAGVPGIGGTGIIGTITGFGSILVNGFTIEYPDDIAIQSIDGPVSADTLQVGQVIAIEAEGEGDRLRARTISLQHAVSGPIERIDKAAGTMVVLGQTVRLADEAVVISEDAKAGLGRLSIGQTVEVSGFRRADGAIEASRIDDAPAKRPAFVSGEVTAIDPAGFTVGNLHIDAPAGDRPAGLTVGQSVTIIGTPSRRRLRARRIAILPLVPFTNRVRRLSLEGLVARGRGGRLALRGFAIPRAAGANAARLNDRVVVTGVVDARRRLRLTAVRRWRLRLRRQRIRRRRQLRRRGGIIRRPKAVVPRRLRRLRRVPRRRPLRRRR